MNNLAIIIPYYKIEFFEKTLKSLAKQTCQNFNVYIGDDASPYNPKNIIDKYAPLLNLTYQRFENNVGGKSLVKQWDRCIQITQDEPWLMILGDDDVLGDNCVEEFYKNLPSVEEHRINVIKFATIEIDGENKVISEKFTHPIIEKSTTAYCRKLKEETRSSLIEYIFKRTIYQEYGFKDFPLAFGSDNLAWIEFTECGNIYAINNAVIYFRLSSLSISGNTQKDKSKKIKSMYLTKRYIIKHYFSDFTKEEKEIILRRAYKELAYSDRRNYLERIRLIFKALQNLPVKTVQEMIFPD